MADVFCLSFVAGLPGIGEAVEVALLEEGDAIAVTEDNRREFVEAYVDCILNASIEKQVGRKQICPARHPARGPTMMNAASTVRRC